MPKRAPASKPLSLATLHDLPDAISVPNYERSALSPGIVHIGMGNFHRAHQAWYLHRLMQQGLAFDWAIIGAGVRAGDADMRARLLSQDCLTTLIELGPSGVSAEVIGSMIDFLPVEEANGVLIAAMSDPQIRIVSLTITEGGYFQDADGRFDPTHPDIRHDAEHPGKPLTAFGAMLAALKNRKDAGLKPFVGQCCDNLQNNGEVLRQTLMGLANLSDLDLAACLSDQMRFPASMVDCIVPATGPKELDLANQLGVLDQAPVTHENFRQWVVEDDFPTGRPPWETVGATLTDQVHSYEAMKIRMLNAGHQLLANAGEILRLETISDCMADPDIAAFFSAVEMREIAPHVDEVPGLDVEEYLSLISSRFSNPEIFDTTRRVAFEGSSRHPGFLLPTLSEALSSGKPSSGLVLAEALWARMCAGTREDGSTIEPNDPHWDILYKAAQDARVRPVAWLEQTPLYGELSSNTDLRDEFSGWLTLIWEQGTRAALRSYLKAQIS